MAKKKPASAVEEGRKVLMACAFMKPSRSKNDEDGNYSMRMTLRIPLKEADADTVDELWGGEGGQMNRIRFAGIPVGDWKQIKIKDFEDQVWKVEVEVPGFSKTKTHWKVSFLVQSSVLTFEEAFELFNGVDGSCEVTHLGPIPQKETGPKIHTPDPNQKSLLDE